MLLLMKQGPKTLDCRLNRPLLHKVSHFHTERGIHGPILPGNDTTGKSERQATVNTCVTGTDINPLA